MSNQSKPAAATTEDRTREATRRNAAWATWVPAAFVVMSLIALLLVPLLLRFRIDVRRERIEFVAEPARDAINDLALTFAREAAVIRTYLLTRSPEAEDRYWELRREEAGAFARLDSLARRLSPSVRAQLVRLRGEVAIWHGDQEALLRGELTPEEYTLRTPPAEPMYERVIGVASDMDAAIAAEVQSLLDQMAAIERLRTILTFALALLAIVSALAVIWFQRRLRGLAKRLDRRAREEQALREAAAAVVATDTIDQTLERITENALSATGADGAFLERLDPDGRTLTVASAAGERTPRIGDVTPLAGSFTEQVLHDRRPAIVPNLGGAQQHRVPASLAQACDGCDALVVPLAQGDETFGALFLLRAPESRRFSPGDVARAGTFGSLVSLAFRKARLLDESERGRWELERVMESRARLVRGFSHDLKNPLGAADGHLALLEEGILGALTEDQIGTVRRGRRSIRVVLDLIHDLVELARAEAGQLEIASVPVEIASIVYDIRDDYVALAKARGVHLTANVPEDLPLLASDPSRLRQVLGNLVSNAVKYTSAGGRVAVTVRECEPVRAGLDERCLCIDVADTGPGIPEDKWEAIFEEFTRLAPGPERGAGLGLSISRRIARIMGGEIVLRSEMGRGSRFTLVLPFAPGGRARKAAA